MLATLEQVLDTAVPFALPMTRTFRGLDVREGVLIPGPSGWGEFAPFDDYSDEAAARWLASAVEAAFGVWPDRLRDDVEVNAIIPAVGPDDAERMTVEAVARGCTTIKVKVGVAGDLQRVAAVRRALGEGGAIRIDANGAWDVATALAVLAQMADLGIDYVEQPCATAAELEQLRGRVPMRVAADELVRSSPDGAPQRLAHIVDLAIIKPAPLGGVNAALDIATSLDVPVVVSGSMDSSVGLDVALWTAACLPEAPAGLGTGALLAGDVVAHTRVPVNGRLNVTRLAPDPRSLAEHPCTRGDWWRQRIARAWRQ